MNVKNKFKLSSVALASAMAMGAMAVPTVASAEVSASVGIANFYLWRGLDISNGAPQVSGSLDYSNSSGFYAGVWGSSESPDTQIGNTDPDDDYDTAGTEYDLYLGYAGAVGDFGYDISYWKYIYPSDNALVGGSMSDSDLSEIVVGLSYSDFGFTAYLSEDVNDPSGASDYMYYTLDYSTGPYSVQYGTWDFDTAGTAGDGDAHITVGYAYNDNLTFTASKGFQDTDATAVYDEDILFHVSYSVPIK